MRSNRTQVAILGAGPAGLVLARLLELEGIESVVLETRTREYVEQRVRAGVLEHGTVECLRDAGVASRLMREGLRHQGVELRFARRGHRIDFSELTGGRAIWLYGQQKVVEDLIEARLGSGLPIHFEVEAVRPERFREAGEPRVRYRRDGLEYELSCDVIAGCDGFHGVCRPAVGDAVRIHEREYPFAWLGVLAQVSPSSEELIYARHERGFALHSMRSPEITRLYLQVDRDEHIEDWPDERIWRELHTRLETSEGFELSEGPVLEKGITPMRSFVADPLRHGRLFLAGDAAHIVPPTGAKGLNLAVADVRRLAAALAEWYRSGRERLLDAYSDACLRRVWRVQHFSWWMTWMFHRDPFDDGFGEQLRLSQLEYVCSSPAAATTLAENYVGWETT